MKRRNMMMQLNRILIAAATTLLLASMFFPLPAAAQEAAAKPAPAGSLADFAWLEGKWTGTFPNAALRAEQEWWPAKGGLMMGMFRLMDGEKLLILEFFTLREVPEGIDLRLRHFDAALTPLEKGDPIILHLVSLAPGDALFENRVHTRPKTSRITRTDPDSFTGRSEIIGDSGATSVIEVQWTREPQHSTRVANLQDSAHRPRYSEERIDLPGAASNRSAGR